MVAEGDEDKSKRDEHEEWEKEKQKWKEEDERSARLHADIEALLKKVQDRHKGEDDDDGVGVRVPV
jgi:TATA-binding protein-associated factor Taf7